MFSQLDSKLLSQWLELLEVLLVLCFVFHLCLNGCKEMLVCSGFSPVWTVRAKIFSRDNLPSKIRTAVGKSFTRRAALRAAVITVVDGTKSYAKELLRFR